MPLIPESWLRIDEEQDICRRTFADPLNFTATWAASLYLLGCLWTLVGIVVFTQNSVLPAIDLCCVNVHPLFASATIYAGFTSLPGLFSTLLATLVGDTSSVAVGACLGSAMLNQLVAISAGVLLALEYHHSDAIKVELAEVGRDIVATGFAIVAVFLVLLDGAVTILEAAALVGLYGLYVIICWFQAVRIQFNLVHVLYFFDLPRPECFKFVNICLLRRSLPKASLTR